MYVATDPSTFIDSRTDSPGFLAFCRAYGVQPVFEQVGNALHCEMLSLGLDFTCTEESVINCVFIFARPHGENKDVTPYDGVLPDGVDFRMSRAHARQRFGEPLKSGEPETFLNMHIPAWDKFASGMQLLHLQYNEKQDGIDLVTVHGKGAMLSDR